MSHPRLDHVAEVLVSGESGGYAYGSGYRLGQRLVLTAGHIVRDNTGSVEVRIGLDREWLAAEVVWRGTSHNLDIALLALSAEVEFIEQDPVRLGYLMPEPARKVGVVATGFPAFNATGRPPVRDTSHLVGSIATHSNRRTLRLEVTRYERLATRGAAWSGMSGAAVFAHGYLIGVIAAADRVDVPLYLSSMESSIPYEEFWRLLSDDGLRPQCDVALRQPPYLDYVRRQAARIGVLRDRQAELDEIWTFARSDEPYRWLVGPPWAGKSALAVWSAADPPADVDVITFFISRTTGAQTAQFLREVCDQLSALLDEVADTDVSQATLDNLWQRACERSERLDRYLLLIVDGLDENDARPPIAALLPSETGSRGHVLLLSRQLPPIPAEVAPGHPLRDRCPRLGLVPSPYAGELRTRAHADLAELLRDRDSRQVLGMLAAGGPMTVDDLAELLALDHFAVQEIASARVLTSAADEDRRVYAHEQLRDATRAMVGDRALAQHRAAIDSWADGYAQEGWPDETPVYLLDHYPALLVNDRDHVRLAALPSPERLGLLQRRVGHDAGATAELTTVLDALATAEEPDLAVMCTIADRRYRLLSPLRQQDIYFPPEIPVAWAKEGQWSRAEYLASHISRPLSAFVGIAEVAARAGDTDRFQHFAAKAMAVGTSRDRDGESVAMELARLAVGARDAGDAELSQRLVAEARTVILRRLAGDPSGVNRFIASAAVSFAELGEVSAADTLVVEMARRVSKEMRHDMGPYRFTTIEQMAQQTLSEAAAAMARVLPQPIRENPVPAVLRLHLEHPCYQARALADFARATDAPILLVAAAARVDAIPAARRPVRLRSRAEPVSVLVAHAAAYVAEVAADMGEQAIATRLAHVALANSPDAGELDTQADVWARVARAFESVGDVDQTDELLDKIQDLEASDEDKIVIGNPIAALIGCAQVARTRERAWTLLMRAEHAAHQAGDRRLQLNRAGDDLVAAVAEFGEPAHAEQIIASLSTGGSSDDAINFIRPLAAVGDVKGANQIVAGVSPDRREYAERLLSARPPSRAEVNTIKPDLLRDMLDSVREAAKRGEQNEVRDRLEEAIQHCPNQAAGSYKIGMQYGRVGIVAAEVGAPDVAKRLLTFLMSTVPYVVVCVPLLAAMARGSEHDEALALLNDAHRLVLAEDGRFNVEAVDLLFEAAVIVDRSAARGMLATSLARSAYTRHYLPQAVRVEPDLAEHLLELLTGDGGMRK